MLFRSDAPEESEPLDEPAVDGPDPNDHAPAEPPLSAAERSARARQVRDDLTTGAGMLTREEVRRALERFRTEVIAVEMPDADLERSILRPALVEILIGSRIDEPRKWPELPIYLRLHTDMRERREYFDDVCAIIGRMAG